MPISRKLPLSRIDRYILSEVGAPFLGGLVFFVFLFLMFQLLRLAEFFIVHGVAGWILIKMVGLLALSFLPTALPVAFLIAVLMAFGRLSSDSELIALKASGLSLSRLCIPVIAISLLVVGLSLGLNLSWVPWGESTFKNILVKVGNTKVASSIKEGTFTSGFFDLLIFAEKVDPKGSTLSRVFIYDERDKKNPMAVVAKSGEILPLKNSSELGASNVLRLTNGSIHRNDPGNDSYQKVDFGEYRLYLKIDEGAANSAWKPQQLSYRRLMDTIRAQPAGSGLTKELWGELWRRIAIASTPIAFVFLGAGFGTVRTRSVRASAGLVTFVTLLVYWTLLTLASTAIHRHWLPPFVAMQVPNAVIFLTAIWAFRRSNW